MLLMQPLLRLARSKMRTSRARGCAFADDAVRARERNRQPASFRASSVRHGVYRYTVSASVCDGGGSDETSDASSRQRIAADKRQRPCRGGECEGAHTRRAKRKRARARVQVAPFRTRKLMKEERRKKQNENFSHRSQRTSGLERSANQGCIVIEGKVVYKYLSTSTSSCTCTSSK